MTAYGYIDNLGPPGCPNPVRCPTPPWQWPPQPESDVPATPYASVSDVTDRWARTPTPLEVTLITTRIADVERKIRRRIPDLDMRIASGRILEADVIQVEADAVLRLARNPDGYQTETDGDYSYTVADALVNSATAQIEILPSEWETLGVVNGMVVVEPFLRVPRPWFAWYYEQTYQNPWWGW